MEKTIDLEANEKQLRIVSAKTSVYGLIGSPIRHSYSPLIHNMYFRRRNRDAVYVAFPTQFATAALTAMRELSLAGFSVTMPCKTDAKAMVDELDLLSDSIGAINTVKNDEGVLHGRNFDGYGFVESLLCLLEKKNPLESVVDAAVLASKAKRNDGTKSVVLGDLQRRRIVFLGAGGAARGIAITLRQVYGHSGEMYFVVRELGEAKELVDDISKLSMPKTSRDIAQSTTTMPAKEISFDELYLKKGERKGRRDFLQGAVVINATPVGMSGVDENESLLTKESFDKSNVVVDIVYSPEETVMLKAAKASCAVVQNGFPMFLRQAALQLSWWLEEPVSLTELNRCYSFARKAF